MYAVFEVAGNQYRAEVGDKVQVERLDKQVGDQFEIDKVFMVADDTGVKVGQPIVAGAKVVASVIEQNKGPRTLIFQYRIGGKRHRTQATHRQNYTWLQVQQIVVATQPHPSVASPLTNVEDSDGLVEGSDGLVEGSLASKTGNPASLARAAHPTGLPSEE